MIIAVTSFAGAPGVTTAAAALAVHWPRPVVLIEADTSAVSSLMAGFLRANFAPGDAGVEKLAFSFSRGLIGTEDILDAEFKIAIALHDLAPIPSAPIPSIPEGHKMWVIPGFTNLAVVDGVRGLWARLPHLLGGIGQGGIDIILDLGRLHVEDPRLPLLDVADRVLVTSTASVNDLNRTYRRLELEDINQRARTLAGERYWALLVEPVAEGVPAREFSKHVLPVVATLPFDSTGAATFSHGRPDPKPHRNSYRGAIRRAVQDLQVLHDRNQRSAG